MKITIQENPMPAARFKSASWWNYQEIKNRLAQEIKLHMFGNVKGGVIEVEDKWDKLSLPIKKQIGLTAVFNRQGHTRCDIDNLLKMAMDVLQTAGVIYNDDQIRQLKASVKKGCDKPSFCLELRTLE